MSDEMFTFFCELRTEMNSSSVNASHARKIDADKHQLGFYTTGEVANLLGFKVAKVIYQTKINKIICSRNPINGKRMFEKEYIDALKGENYET